LRALASPTPDDERVDPDDVALDIDERVTAVAMVDGCVV
jgi:hypothetical protein